MLSSESVEEYLEAIYSYNERNELARNSDLSKRLRVSPPSVTQMIRRLEEDGLVKHEPYKGTLLTGKGSALAQRVVRKHRLLERFLHDFLGLDLERVHNEACRLEHSLSDEAAAAICEKLDVPETCPDDENIIPPCPMQVEQCSEFCVAKEDGYIDLITQLSNLHPGEEGEVVYIRGDQASCRKVEEIGLFEGARIRVMESEPFEGPLKASVGGSYTVIERGLAEKIFVQMDEGERSWERKHPHGPHHGPLID